MSQQQQEQQQDNDDSPLQAAMRLAVLIRKNVVTQTEKQQPTPTTNESSLIRSFRFPGPPGLIEGVATGLVVFAVLTPARSFLTKRFFSASSSSLSSAAAIRRGGTRSNGDGASTQQQQQQQQQNPFEFFLPDFLMTTTQLLLSAHAALYMGSLYGSHHYLHQFASSAVATAADPSVAPVMVASHNTTVVDTICRDPLVSHLLQRQDQGTLVLPSTTSTAFPPTTTTTNNNNNINNQNIVNSKKSSSSLASSMLNPNQRVLMELQRALNTCRTRNNNSSFQDESSSSDNNNNNNNKRPIKEWI